MLMMRVVRQFSILFTLTAIMHAPADAAEPNHGPNNENPDYCMKIARETVAKFGITSADITDSSIDIVQTTNDITITTDVIAWFRIKQCPSARLVVQLQRECQLPLLHTVGNCKIKGIPDY